MYSILALLLLVRSALGQEGVEKALRRLRDSVDRFEANLHRAVDDYGRTGLVRGPLDEMASHQFRLEDHSDVDFPKAVAQAEQRLQHFFDSKTAALRRLVSAAERAATRLNPDKPVASLLDRECMLHLRQVNRSSVKNEAIWRNRAQVPSKSGVHVATESYKCSGPVVRDFGWTGQQQLDDQMADNARQDPALLRQYIGTYSGLTRVFPGFHWDIGPEQFSVDLFDPRFRPWFVVAESGPRDILFLVDFSGSAKGVNAHLIKTSVMAVLQTLSPNDFFSGIWYNSRRERVLANCTEPADGFIQATSRNKLLFRRFLDRIDERDQATLPAALEMSFGEFLRDQPTSATSANSSDASDASGPVNNGGQQRPQSGRSGGHQLILLFTDGIEFWPTEEVQRYQQAHPNEPIRVFGHSVGYGRGPQPALDWLTCQTRAGPGQAVVGTVADVRLKARMYLTKLNELLALAYRDKASLPENRPISWPVPYMDVQRGGPVISLSMPVLGPQPSAYQDLETAKQRVRDGKQPQQLDGFLGVAGLDVPFAALAKALTLEGEVNPELAYAFLVDNNGIVYFHPRLQTPAASTFAVRKTLCHRLSTLLRSNTRVPFSRADELVHQQMGHLDSIGQSDILELEPSAGEEIWRRFRTNLVLGRCAETLEDERRQLRCFAIRGTPLVAGFVLNKGRPKVVLKEPPAEAEDPFELAERLRTALGSTDEDAEATAENNNSSYNNNSTISSSQLPPTVGILLREDQLQQWELSMELSHAKGFNRFGKLLLPLLPKANAQWLAHLSALEPDSLFPKWASKWSGNESAVCPSRAPFVSAFLELRSSALAGRPGVVAAFPRCELPSIKSFLRLSASQEESAITRLTVHVDPAKDGGLLTVEQPLGVLDGRRPLARVGVQLRGHYLQQKMQRALQQPADGWAECLGAAGGAEERKCLLVNGDSFVLASSSSAGPPTVDQSPLAFRPVHLSQQEPELFAEMQARGLIKRIAWRDPTGLCPMVMEMRHRQQHFPALYYMPASSEPPATASAPSAISMPAIVGQLLGLIPAWAALLFPALLHVHASTPVSEHIIEPLEDVDCEIEPQPELVEHCTLERSRFRLRARAKERPGDQPKTTALWLREKHCNRTVGLLPFGRSELFLLLLDGKCQQKPSAQPSPPLPPPSFVHQAQVPNCNLTLESLRQPRRARADLLIFGRSHPKEFNQICSSGANRPAAGGGLFSPVHALSLITSIFLLFLHLNSKFFFT